MNKQLKSLVFLFLTMGSALAEGTHSEGHAGVSSLVPSAFNVVLLIIIIVYLVKKPMTAYFLKSSHEIAKKINLAETQTREADAMLVKVQEKMSQLSANLDKHEAQSREYLTSFIKKQTDENNQKIIRLKEEGVLRIEQDKLNLLNKLEERLLSLIVEKAKEEVKRDHSLKEKISQKLVKG